MSFFFSIFYFQIDRMFLYIFNNGLQSIYTLFCRIIHLYFVYALFNILHFTIYSCMLILYHNRSYFEEIELKLKFKKLCVTCTNIIINLTSLPEILKLIWINNKSTNY